MHIYQDFRGLCGVHTALHKEKTSESRWGDRLGDGIQGVRDALGTFISTYEKRSNAIFNNSIEGSGTALDTDSIGKILARLYAYNRQSETDGMGIIRASQLDHQAKEYVEIATDLDHQDVMDVISVESLTTVRMYEHMRDIGLEFSKNMPSHNMDEDGMLQYVGKSTRLLASSTEALGSASDFPTFFESAYKCLAESSKILAETHFALSGVENYAKSSGVFVERFDLPAETGLVFATLMANRSRNG